VPVTAPGFAPKTRGERTTVFFTATPALVMIDAPFSTFASAAVWIVPFSCCSSWTSAVFCSSRVTTAPFVRASAAVSAVWRSAMAAEMVTSEGTTVGKEALPVTAFTMPWAYVMRAGTRVGSLRTTIER